MNVRFEELSDPQRAGGIEAATRGLVSSLGRQGVAVNRSAENVTTLTVASDRPAVVHFHGIWSPTQALRLLAWRRRGIPCMVTLHGMLEPWALAHKALKKRVAWNLYQKRLLNMASALHATSEREAENLRKLGLTPPIAMIPWGVELPRREPEGQKIEGQRTEEGAQNAPETSITNQKFNIQNSPTRTALFVGRIFPVKGLPMLVEAWAKVRPEGWKMKIVGPDQAGHLAQVKALVCKAGLDTDFEFTGALEGADLAKAYQTADLFVMPSYTENFSMVVAEAMAQGMPVITTYGAPWKLLEEESCGWWVPVSVDGIAAALDDATRRSPGVLTAMGERGRSVVAERFAWDKIAAEMIACYEWLLGGGTKPGCVV